MSKEKEIVKDEEKVVEGEPTESAGLRVIGVIRTIFIYIVAIGIIIAAIMFASSRSEDKSIFGYRYYTVLTPSMKPELSVGDLVIVKLVDADEIEVGDVITFNPSTDNDTYLTHRVTEKIDDYEGTGVTCFKTKGDANEDEDGFLLDEDRVIGTVTLSIPKLGYVIRFVQLRWYFVLAFVVLVFILFRLLRIFFTPSDDEKEVLEEEVLDETADVSANE